MLGGININIKERLTRLNREMDRDELDILSESANMLFAGLLGGFATIMIEKQYTPLSLWILTPTLLGIAIIWISVKEYIIAYFRTRNKEIVRYGS